MVNDPVSDLIIRIKNASMVGKEEVELPYSKLKHAIADVLVKEGYLAAAEKQGKKAKKTLLLTLKDGAVSDVRRISKPGRRLYVKSADIFPVKFGQGRRIISTPAGILTGEEAREKNVGGEELFIIW